MKNLALLALAVVIAFSGSTAFAQDGIYPFMVKLDGQEAAVKGAADSFATVDQAVSNEAELEVAVDGQVIVNIFPCDDSGTPVSGAAPTLLMFEAPKVQLSKTLDGSKLESGKYLANIIGGGTTARVVFQVK